MHANIKLIKHELKHSENADSDNGTLMNNFDEVRKVLLPQMQSLTDQIKQRLRKPTDGGVDVFEDLRNKLGVEKGGSDFS